MKTITRNIKRMFKTTVVINTDKISPLLAEYIPKDCLSIMVVSDRTVGELYGEKVIRVIREAKPDAQIHHFFFPPGEAHKVLSTVESLIDRLMAHSFDKKSIVINLGGGIVSDLGGFGASIYMRGIPYINMPTTVEAMADASIGGKTGVNVQNLKNYVGVVSHPTAVLIDTSFLNSLPKRPYRQGFSEILKHGLIQDIQLVNRIIKIDVDHVSQNELQWLIARSIEIKSSVVYADELERGIRKVLNFGHTLGHAIETIKMGSHDAIFHGEAVAIGMIGEAKISELIGNMSHDEFLLVERAVKSLSLPTRIDSTEEKIFQLLKTDKKNQGGRILWTVLDHIGAARFDVEVDSKIVRKAIQYITRL